MASTTVLLVNLGTPIAPTAEAVRTFLQEFLSDPLVIDLPRWLWQPILRRMVLRSRPQRVAELYESIWYRTPCGPVCPGGGCSPLECGTRRLAAAVGQRLDASYRVDWAYRYGERSIRRGLQAAIDAGADSILVVPLFPQRTCSTSGSIERETERAAAELGIGCRVQLLQIEPGDRGYAAGLAARARARLAEEAAPPEHLLVSFHGIPTRYDRREGGQYVRDCRATTDALLRELSWPRQRATLCYQSKFGPEPWLKPATAKVVEGMPARGVRRLAVITPGFLTEGLETLEEIAVQARDAFLAAGGERFLYLPAVEDAPAFAATLEALVRGAAAPARREASA